MPRLLYTAAAAVAALLSCDAFAPSATGVFARPRVVARQGARASRAWLQAKLESITVEPIEKATGTVVLPGSKSLSNRALLLAALSEVGEIRSGRCQPLPAAAPCCCRAASASAAAAAAADATTAHRCRRSRARRW